MNKLTISLTIFAMALAGCGDDDRDGDDTITLMDSGPGGDMGPVGMDMGPVATDMGPTGMCAETLPALPADFYPRCSADTLTCVEGATTNAEINTCIDNDATAPYMDMAIADCGYCVNFTSIQCADANGCHGEWAALNCCLEASGCGETDQACFQAECGTEIGAFQACEPTADCQAQVQRCFPSGG